MKTIHNNLNPSKTVENHIKNRNGIRQTQGPERCAVYFRSFLSCRFLPNCHMGQQNKMDPEIPECFFRIINSDWTPTGPHMPVFVKTWLQEWEIKEICCATSFNISWQSFSTFRSPTEYRTHSTTSPLGSNSQKHKKHSFECLSCFGCFCIVLAGLGEARTLQKKIRTRMDTFRAGLTLPNIRNSWFDVLRSTLSIRIDPHNCRFCPRSPELPFF